MTDKYAVIGNPISHSKSPQIHQMFAEQTEQDISYEAILAPLNGFVATIDRLREEGYKGCSVTVPFKFEAYKLATPKKNKSFPARFAQSANTLIFDVNKSLKINNTDGDGLIRDIRKNWAFKLKGKRVLLMGAGGAALGAFLPLIKSNASIIVVNRSVENAKIKTDNFVLFPDIPKSYLKKSKYTDNAKKEPQVIGYQSLLGHKFDLIINATSSGLSDEMPPLPPTIFAPNALAYDMMYGRETPFMKFARDQGAQVADGLGMLVEQAAEAFYLWRGVRPDTAAVIAALRNSA
mgnify:CR=1 FL=1